MSNTFDDVLKDLRSSASAVALATGPIDTVTTILKDIDGLLVAAGDAIGFLNMIDRALELLGGALDFLSAVPVIGQIADAMSALIAEGAALLADAIRVAQQVKRDLIDPVTKVLGDAVKGLGDIRTVVVDIGIKVPGYINTIQILSYLEQVAEPLIAVLQGSAAQDKLLALTKTFDDVRAEVGSALDTLAPFFHGVNEAVGALNSAIHAALAGIGDGPRAALAGLQSAMAALNPITDGFEKAVNAIKPVKWVLDAIACIVNKVLTPVIDWILRVTGLDTLVHAAEAAIFEKLGITPLLDVVEKSIDPKSVGQSGGQVSPAQGAQAKILWTQLGSALGQYRSGDSEATKKAIFGLIGAVTDTPIDPHKPAVAPPFPPDVPPLASAADVAGGPSSPLRPAGVMGVAPSFALATVAAVGQAPLQPHSIMPDFSVLDRLRLSPPLRANAMSLFVLAAADDRLADAPLAVDLTQWPQCAQALDTLNALATALHGLAPTTANLSAALVHLDTALTLPADFQQQTDLLHHGFRDIGDVLAMLGKMPLDAVTHLVAPLRTVLAHQQSELDTVVAAMPRLIGASTDLREAARPTLAAIPDCSVVDQALHRIDGWVLGIRQLVAMVETGRSVDAGKGNIHKAALDAFAAQIEGNAAALGTRGATILSHVSSLTGAVANLGTALDGFAAALSQLSPHSQLIASNAMPALHHAVQVLDTIDSILDPLWGLLVQARCVDGGSSLKQFGAEAVDTIRSVGTAASVPAPTTFVQIAEQLSDRILPLGELATAVAAAGTQIGGPIVDAFRNNAASLTTGLTALSREIAETKSYQITINGKTETVENDLMDTELVTEARSLIAALSG